MPHELAAVDVNRTAANRDEAMKKFRGEGAE